MIYVGIDVAKDKHDCFITNSDGKVLFKALGQFTRNYTQTTKRGLLTTNKG